ncbi:MAG TPA: hypothetical protein VGW33_08070, partial [Terriglobia bacterium]|nr:hypothetical protein [Terriglobia bacterium]
VRTHDDVALYDWIYAQACLAFSPAQKEAWSDAAQVAREVWCLVREGNRRDLQPGGAEGWQKSQTGLGGRAGSSEGGPESGQTAGPQGGPEGDQRGWRRPGRASLWCHFRIPTRLNGGYGTKPRYAVKSLDTRLTSRIRFTVNGPFEGFRTNLRLKFWVRGPRRPRRPGLEWPPHLDPRAIWEEALAGERPGSPVAYSPPAGLSDRR